MKRIDIGYLYLEITRRCTLECLHCMRGNRENIDMSEEILDNIFKDISHIRELDLGGGEPLLVPKIIERIINKIYKYGISVDLISFTTNGTVLTPEIIFIISKLQQIAPLNVRLSHDKFHLMDIYIKQLTEQVTRNTRVLTSILGYNPKDKYFITDDGIISRIGKAEQLTQEFLDEINKWLEPTYYHFGIKPPTRHDIIKIYDWEKPIIQVCGSLTISATGYLSQNDKEYKHEDTGPIFNLNVKDQSLLDAIIKYEEEYKNWLGEEEYEDYRKELDTEPSQNK